VAVWSGWVGLGTLCGFGIVHPLPGIAPGFELNTAITLPVGVEAYGAYALGAWLTPGTPDAARRFAARSAAGSLALGMLGQVAYHLLAAWHATRAPWPVVVLVACLPVITLGAAAALTHLLRAGHDPAGATGAAAVAPAPGPVAPAVTAGPAPALPAAAAPAAAPPRRAGSPAGTAAKVARLRAQHPDMTVTEIARRAGVSDRTVRRHLNPPGGPPALAA
jgi:DNA-binding transcriptional ArsR family regulator